MNSSGLSKKERDDLEDVFLSISRTNKTIVKESLYNFFKSTKIYTINIKKSFNKTKYPSKLPKHR
ncbi:MAG: hypothetical protein U9N42_03075 [Campylobacterota bacterium]|nr:hypothetical protein [Campylobacterota bacterium]